CELRSFLVAEVVPGGSVLRLPDTFPGVLDTGDLPRVVCTGMSAPSSTWAPIDKVRPNTSPSAVRAIQRQGSQRNQRNLLEWRRSGGGLEHPAAVAVAVAVEVRRSYARRCPMRDLQPRRA